MKQQDHIRRYRSGKRTRVNPGVKKRSFFGFKRIPERWVITRDMDHTNAVWSVKDPKDKDLTYFQLVEYGPYINSPYGDADHDAIPNIFDKKPLSIKVTRQVPPSVKQGNTKLTKVIGIFSLPRYYTCPGKTELCSKYCYAEAPEMYRPSVVYSRNKNLAWTQREDFVKVMSEIIRNMKLPYFRIHEAGDFYDQDYLEKWIQIARNVPNTRFLAYTKNYKLNFKTLPDNFTIRYSSDVSSTNIREELPQCYVGVQQPEGFFSCKKKCEPGFCMACWDKHIDVYIPVHSVGKQHVDQMFFKQFNPSVPKALAHRHFAKGYVPSPGFIGHTKWRGL